MNKIIQKMNEISFWKVFLIVFLLGSLVLGFVGKFFVFSQINNGWPFFTRHIMASVFLALNVIIIFLTFYKANQLKSFLRIGANVFLTLYVLACFLSFYLLGAFSPLQFMGGHIYTTQIEGIKSYIFDDLMAGNGYSTTEGFVT